MNTLRLAYNKYIKQLKDAGVQASEIPPICDVNDTLFLAYLKNIKNTIKQYKKHSEGGSIVTFNALPNTNIENLLIDIEPVQSGSGDPSPDNIRPISGWEGMKMSRTAKNLWGGDRWYDSGVGTADLENRTISGTSSKTLPLIGSRAVRFKEKTPYTFIITMTNSNSHTSGYYFVYTDGSSTNLNNSNIGTEKKTFAFVSNANKTLQSISRTSYSGTKTYYVDESGIFEGDLTVDDFVPYDGQTYSVNWETEAGTVYGGTLDVTTGVLTVDWRMLIFNSVSDFYSVIDSGDSTLEGYTYVTLRYNLPSNEYAYTATPNDGDTNGLCNIAKWRKGAEPGFSRVYAVTINRIYFVGVSNVYDLKTAEGQTAYISSIAPIQVAYKLATPQTYQLSPTEIKALGGLNNIFADTGDIISFDYYGT